MGFNKYPYTDLHEMNLDWIIARTKELIAKWAETSAAWLTQQEAFESLKNFVNDYFDNLDVQQEINNKLDGLVADGTLSELIAPYVASGLPAVVADQIAAVVADQIAAVVADQIDAVVADQLPDVAAAAAAQEVSDWLEQHVDPETGYVIDDSLTVQGAAADAKAVGDDITELKSAVSDIGKANVIKSSHWTKGGLNSDMTSTNTRADRARIQGAYLPEIPANNHVYLFVSPGYVYEAATYNSSDFTDIDEIIAGSSAWVSGNLDLTAYAGKYFGLVIAKSDYSNFTDDEILALENQIYIVHESLVGDVSKLTTEDKKTVVDAVNEVNSNVPRLPNKTLNWLDFSTVEYATGWRVGSWTDSGAHNTGAGNAIHLISMMTSEDFNTCDKIKITFPGGYTASWKVFLKSSPTTLYQRTDFQSGTEITIDHTINALYGFSIAGFGTSAQSAIDNNYPNDVKLTLIENASDGVFKKYRNRDADYFYVSVNKTYPNDFDDADPVNVDCVLMLPSNYTPYGEPTKLIFMHHGNSGTVNVQNETWYSESNVWSNFVDGYLNAGYAVFDVNGAGSVSDSNASHDYASFLALSATYKAYKYIVDNYNIDVDLFVHGSSMGGATAYAFAKQFSHVVRAVGLFSPALLSRSADMASVRDYVAYNYGYADYAAMVADNYSRLLPSNPCIKYVNASGVEVVKPYTYDWVNDAETDGLITYVKDFNAPLKIWCGTADTSVDPLYGDKLSKSITRNGGMAIFESIEGAGHSAGLGGNSDVIAEAVEWFNRF